METAKLVQEQIHKFRMHLKKIQLLAQQQVILISSSLEIVTDSFFGHPGQTRSSAYSRLNQGF